MQKSTRTSLWFWLSCTAAIALAPLSLKAQAISSEPLSAPAGVSSAPLSAPASTSASGPRLGAPTSVTSQPVTRAAAPAPMPAAAPVTTTAASDSGSSMLGHSEPGTKKPSGIAPHKPKTKVATLKKTKPKSAVKSVQTASKAKPKPKAVKPKLPGAAPVDGANS